MSTFESVQDIIARTAASKGVEPTPSSYLRSDDAGWEKARNAVAENYGQLIQQLSRFTSPAGTDIRQPAVFEDLHALNLAHLSSMLYKDIIVLRSITSSDKC
jgi:hypothetical protein